VVALLIIISSGCGSSVDKRAADTRLANERADHIGTLLHGWRVLKIPSSGVRCRVTVGRANAASVRREYDYPPTGAVAEKQVDISVVVFPSALLATKWIEAAQGPRGRECIRASTKRIFQQMLRRPLRVTVIPGLPKWLRMPGIRFEHGFTVDVTSGGYTLAITKAEFHDRRDPRIAYDIAVGGIGGARALTRSIVAAAGT